MHALTTQGGRAVGTLGHEEELRRLRRQLIPKKLMTRLAVGGLFGGGPAAMGEGEMQASLKVETRVVCLSMEVGGPMCPRAFAESPTVALHRPSHSSTHARASTWC